MVEWDCPDIDSRVMMSNPASDDDKRPDAKPRAFERVSEQIREMVLGGPLKPGDRLPSERELSARLGVGRPVLREALRKIEHSGLIELRKGRSGGAFVSRGNPGLIADNMSDLIQLRNISIQELYEARTWIQEAVVRVACQRATPEDLQALEENVRAAEEEHARGRADERTIINIEFHNLLARATHNPVMVIMVRGLTDALRSLVQQVGSEQPRSLFRVRHQLVEAVRKKDEEAAVKAMIRILRESEKMYLALAARREKNADRKKAQP